MEHRIRQSDIVQENHQGTPFLSYVVVLCPVFVSFALAQCAAGKPKVLYPVLVTSWQRFGRRKFRGTSGDSDGGRCAQHRNTRGVKQGEMGNGRGSGMGKMH